MGLGRRRKRDRGRVDNGQNNEEQEVSKFRQSGSLFTTDHLIRLTSFRLEWTTETLGNRSI